MAEYTGNYFMVENSCVFGQTVNVLEYRDKQGTPHGGCFRCGKLLRKHWWTVQDLEDVEICNIGSECVKRLS